MVEMTWNLEYWQVERFAYQHLASLPPPFSVFFLYFSHFTDGLEEQGSK